MVIAAMSTACCLAVFIKFPFHWMNTYIPSRLWLVFACLGIGFQVWNTSGQVLRLPTANRAILEPGKEDQYFVGTVGKPWLSGAFGCVRSNGRTLHEGIDIKCLQRDRKGEPIDPIFATADGAVVYVNTRPALSNYGNYLILRHVIDGLEIYSLYAHLSAVRSDLRVGRTVKAGEVIGTMGRTANTREGISRERAHVHFELNLLVNDRFASWYKRHFPDQRNDHGAWNGRNMVGLDPRAILVAAHEMGARFSLLQYVRQQTELCRVLVRATRFPWIQRYPTLIRRNPVVDREGIAGYEIALNFNGVPFELIPRAKSELKTKAAVHLLSVNEAERKKNPCRNLVVRKGQRWLLGEAGRNLIDLLTY